MMERFWNMHETMLCVFDLDGTLVNSVYDIAEAINRSLIIMNKPTHSVEAFYTMVGDGMEMLCRRALENGTEEEVKTLIALYKEYYLSHCTILTKPYNGIENLLKELYEHGIRLAILSNKPQEQTDEVVFKLLPKKVFSYIIGQSERFPKKPNPSSLNYIISSEEMEISNVYYIGDSDVDMQLGKSVGVHTIGVEWGFRPREELEKSGADFIASSPEKLRDYLLKKIFEKNQKKA